MNRISILFIPNFILFFSEKQINFAYQTLTDTCPEESYFNETKQNKSAIPDSMALQFENKIDDFLIVPETPPENNSSQARQTPSKHNSSILDSQSIAKAQTETIKAKSQAHESHDFDLLKDSFDFKSQKKASPDVLRKKLEFTVISDQNSQANNPVGMNVDMLVSERAGKKCIPEKAKIKVKQEKIILNENDSIVCYKKLDLHVVYTKKRPPAHSIKSEVIFKENLHLENISLGDKSLLVRTGYFLVSVHCRYCQTQSPFSPFQNI